MPRRLLVDGHGLQPREYPVRAVPAQLSRTPTLVVDADDESESTLTGRLNTRRRGVDDRGPRRVYTQRPGRPQKNGRVRTNGQPGQLLVVRVNDSADQSIQPGRSQSLTAAAAGSHHRRGQPQLP